MLSAAKRELEEETGLASSKIWLCGTVTIDTGENRGIGIFVYRGEFSSGELIPSQEGALEWVPLNQVFELPLVEDLHTLLPKVLEADKAAAPFSALYVYDHEGKLQISFGE